MKLAELLNPQQVRKLKQLLNLFRDPLDRGYGDLFTENQLLIVALIAGRVYPRTQLILPTQYGKSMAVALGLIIRVTSYKEKWAILAPSEDKARIIMDYFIEHVFDSIAFSERLEYYDTKEKLKQERSKQRLTFRGAGELRIFTANANNKQQVKKALMGFGSPNLICDESSLLDDDLYATAKRMVGGTIDNFMLEIGNPFFRNHFWRTWNGDRYKKVFVDYNIALAEGRYSQDYIDEMRDEAFFDVLYECKFPNADDLLPGGYRRLASDENIDGAWVDCDQPIIEGDKPVLGIDVARGGKNKTIFTIRYIQSNWGKKVKEIDADDLEYQADVAEDLIKQYNVPDYHTTIDDTGVGGGLTDILKHRGHLVQPIVLGSTSVSERPISGRYLNVRAQMHWEFRKWLRAGGKIVRDPGFEEFRHLNYRETSLSKIQIEPKEELRKRNIPSPDNSDAFILTFIDTAAIIDSDDIEIL